MKIWDTCTSDTHTHTWTHTHTHTQARDGTLAIEDMDGGTFTVSNGGVFGSMFGTPIINPPQSAILGMHAVIDRPMAINGKVQHHSLNTSVCVGRGGGEGGTKAEGGGINGLGMWVKRIARSLCSLSHVTSQKNLRKICLVT